MAVGVITGRFDPRVQGEQQRSAKRATKMPAFVSPERARTASLTGVIGLLILVIAVVMMVIAAPTHVHYGAHNPAKPSAVQLTTDLYRHRLLTPAQPST